MDKRVESLIKQMIGKSIEAFIMGIEIYNKPTIKYRIEGFSFFAVNAWELILKAVLLKRGISIYYKDNPDRTISVSDALKKVYTDKHTHIRQNLERIIELRNTSTHFITEEYEAKYAPLFQACVMNYVNEIKRFHGIDITDHIAQNFLMLSVHYEPLSNEQIRIKYPPEIAEKFIQRANTLDVLEQTNSSEKFSIPIKQNMYITKKKSEADFTVSIVSGSDNKVSKIKELQDPADTHRYSFNDVILLVNDKLKKKSIKLGYEQGFNSYVLRLIIDFYNIKSDPKYAYEHTIGKQHQYTYSQQFVDYIIDEIKKNPKKFVESLKHKEKR